MKRLSQIRGGWRSPETLHKFPEPLRSAMQVSEADGGKLNAFAREPRLVVLVAVAAGIS